MFSWLLTGSKYVCLHHVHLWNTTHSCSTICHCIIAFDLLSFQHILLHISSYNYKHRAPSVLVIYFKTRIHSLGSRIKCFVGHTKLCACWHHSNSPGSSSVNFFSDLFVAIPEQTSHYLLIYFLRPSSNTISSLNSTFTSLKTFSPILLYVPKVLYNKRYNIFTPMILTTAFFWF